MATPFLITGLPRSRTAWLSVAATTQNSFCYHEPLPDLSRWQDIYDLWSESDYSFIGISDSALGFHLSEILSHAKPRTLVVDRPVDEVIRSLSGIGIDNSARYCGLLSWRIDEAADHPLVRRVTFRSLSDDNVVADCLSHLMPGESIDMRRIRHLQRLVIQPEMTRVFATANERSGDVCRLLGDDVIEHLKGNS